VPPDKAAEIGRQICAGLAAAHERGVLHRDLKPGNVMLDGRGRARITDFGLAAALGDIARHDVRSGTPAYMAPEQIAGREVTVQSDLYALGLVLYELFTGRRAVAAQEPLVPGRRDPSQSIDAPSSHLSSIDPAVERVILHCLEPDPEMRPASALAVAAALPGGDPLAAALAAGETPSPELVAATGGVGALRPAVALGWLAALIACLTLVILQARTHSLLGVLRPEKPPAVLAERAHQILALAGFPARPVDQAMGVETDDAQLAWMNRHGPRRRSWSDLAAGRAYPLGVWYRQSNQPIRPYNDLRVVTPVDPPLSIPGSAGVWLDGRGQLTQMIIAPPQVEPTGDSGRAGMPFDWTVLLHEAGIDSGTVHPVVPGWTPPMFVDSRRAWENAAYADSTVDGVRIEAGSYRGRATYLTVLRPWTRAGRTAFDARTGAQRVGSALSLLLLVASIIGAGWLAVRNVRLGRGDRRGAIRVAVTVFVLGIVSIALQAHPPATVEAGVSLLFNILGESLFPAVAAWMLYLALEPLVRRVRPRGLVGWTRLLGGRWRDPRVGRDLLIGSAFGALLLAVLGLNRTLPAWLGLPVPPPAAGSLDALVSGRFAMAALLSTCQNAIVSAMLLAFFSSMSGFDPRGSRYGGLVFFAFAFGLNVLSSSVGPAIVRIPVLAVFAALVTILFFRFGLLAGIATLLWLAWNIPLPVGTGDWWAGTALLALACLLAVAGFGFATAIRDGRRAPRA
jgi:serine/threonine-protein kinase